MTATLPQELGWEDLRDLVTKANKPAPRTHVSGGDRRLVTTSPLGNHCEVDGQTYSDHLSCVECTILVGPGHLEQGLDDLGRCGNCSMPIEDRILGWIVPPTDEELEEEEEYWEAA